MTRWQVVPEQRSSGKAKCGVYHLEPLRAKSVPLWNDACFQFGNANATRVPPRGRPLLPPPAAMTTYCRPLTM